MENLYQVTFSLRFYDSSDRCVESAMCQVFCEAPSQSAARDFAYHHVKESTLATDGSSADIVVTSVRLIYSSHFIR